MGQQVSVDSVPQDLSSIIARLDSLSTTTTSSKAPKPSFKSNLKIWSFEYNALESEVQISAERIEDNFQVERSKCYLVLLLERGTEGHIPSSETHHVKSASLGSDASLQAQLRLPIKKNSSLMKMSIATTELLTPRGLEYAFSSSAQDALMSHNMQHANRSARFSMYVWNGKDADVTSQASAIANAYTLEHLFLKHPQVLETVLDIGDPVPLSQVVTDDISPQSKKNLLQKIHILSHFIQEEEQTSLSSLLVMLSSHLSGKDERPPASLTNSNSAERSPKHIHHMIGSVPPAATTNNTQPKFHLAINMDSKHKMPPPLSRESSKSSTRSNKTSSSRSHRSSVSNASSLVASSSRFMLDLNSVERGTVPDPSPTPRSNRLYDSISETHQLSAAQKIQFYRRRCSKIISGVYLGSDLVARNKEELQKHKITHIINAARVACGIYFPDDFKYIYFSLYDSGEESIIGVFFHVIDFFEKAFANGGKIYVHCHEGVSRSSALLISYFMWKKKLPYNTVLENVKARREVCSPNAGFFVQLVQWEKMLKDPQTYLFRMAPLNDRFAEHGEIYAKLCNSKELDSRTCFVLWGAKSPCIYLWVGSKCQLPVQQRGEEFVTLFKQYFILKDIPLVIIKESSPSSQSLPALPSLSIPTLNTSSLLDNSNTSTTTTTTSATSPTVQFYNLLDQVEINTKLPDANKEYKDLAYFEKVSVVGVPQTSTTKDDKIDDDKPLEAEPAELYEYQDETDAWELIGKFDGDDLYDDKMYILKPKTKNDVFVWLGEDFELSNTTSREQAALKLATKFLTSLNTSSTSDDFKITVVKQGDESDQFWKYFTDG